MKNFFPAIVAFGLSYGVSTYSSAMSNSQNIKREKQTTGSKHIKKDKGDNPSKNAMAKFFQSEEKNINR